MTVETDLQRDIRQSVRRQGGYCIKLSNRFTIGVPDLLIALAPFAPCYVEVKKLGKCVLGFDRQLDVTPKQGHELRGLSDQYPAPLSFIFVGVEWNSKDWVYGGYHAERRLMGDTLNRTMRKVPRQVGGFYNVRHLLTTLGAGKVAE